MTNTRSIHGRCNDKKSNRRREKYRRGLVFHHFINGGPVSYRLGIFCLQGLFSIDFWCHGVILSATVKYMNPVLRRVTIRESGPGSSVQRPKTE